MCFLRIVSIRIYVGGGLAERNGVRSGGGRVRSQSSHLDTNSSAVPSIGYINWHNSQGYH